MSSSPTEISMSRYSSHQISWRHERNHWIFKSCTASGGQRQNCRKLFGVTCTVREKWPGCMFCRESSVKLSTILHDEERSCMLPKQETDATIHPNCSNINNPSVERSERRANRVLEGPHVISNVNLV